MDASAFGGSVPAPDVASRSGRCPSLRPLPANARCHGVACGRPRPRGALLGALGLLILLSPLGCSSGADRAQSARERVVNALERGERRQALAALEALRESRTDTPESLIEFAALLVQTGEALRALWLLEAGVREFPDRDELRLALANVALLIDDPARARAHLERIAPDSPYHVYALIARARAALELGDGESALALFEEAERLHPHRPEASILRIQVLLDERRIEESRAVLVAAQQSVRGEAERAALRRAEIAVYEAQLTLGESEPVLDELDRLVREAPQDVAAWQSFARAHLRAGRPRTALERLQAALQEDPGHLALHPLVATLHLELGDIAAAEKSLREFVDRSGSPTAHIGLAQFHAAQGGRERSLALFQQAAQLFPDEPAVHFARAEALMSWGLVDESRGALRQLRRSAPPTDPRIDYLEARIQLAEGDAAGARSRLQALVPRFDTAVTQYWLGAALESLGDRVGAHRRYRAAAQRAPSLPESHRALLRLAERRGDWGALAGHARSLLRLLPREIDGWSALVEAQLRLGHAREAEATARRCLERLPDQSRPHVLLARALGAQGRHAEALARLDRALGGHPSSPELEAERSLALARAGRADEALQAVRRALSARPEAPRLHLTLAVLLFAEDQRDAGWRAIDRALELDAEDPQPLRVRAEFGASAGLSEEARRDTERYLERRPDDARMLFLLGVLDERLGNTEQAIAAYRRAAALDPNAFLARNNLAELLAARDELDGALAMAQQAYRIEPESPHVLDTLGGLYLRKGLPQRALFFLEQAHAARPEWTQTRLRLALAHRDAGLADPAREMPAELRSRDGTALELNVRADTALR